MVQYLVLTSRSHKFIDDSHLPMWNGYGLEDLYRLSPCPILTMGEDSCDNSCDESSAQDVEKPAKVMYTKRFAGRRPLLGVKLSQYRRSHVLTQEYKSCCLSEDEFNTVMAFALAAG